MKHAISTSYAPPQDAGGVVALMALDQWLEDGGLKLEEGKHGLGFPFMYLLLTGTMGLKVNRCWVLGAGCWVRASRVTYSHVTSPHITSRDVTSLTSTVIVVVGWLRSDSSSCCFLVSFVWCNQPQKQFVVSSG